MELIENWKTTPLISDNKGNLLNVEDMISNLSGRITDLQDQEDRCTGLVITFPPIDQERRLAMQSTVEHRPVSYEFDLFTPW